MGGAKCGWVVYGEEGECASYEGCWRRALCKESTSPSPAIPHQAHSGNYLAMPAPPARPRPAGLPAARVEGGEDACLGNGHRLLLHDLRGGAGAREGRLEYSAQQQSARGQTLPV